MALSLMVRKIVARLDERSLRHLDFLLEFVMRGEFYLASKLWPVSCLECRKNYRARETRNAKLHWMSENRRIFAYIYVLLGSTTPSLDQSECGIVCLF